MIFSVYSWFNSLYIILFFWATVQKFYLFIMILAHTVRRLGWCILVFCFVKPCVSLTRHAFLLWLRYQEFGITCLHFSVSVLFLAMAVLSCVGQCVLLPFLVRAYLFVSFVRKPQKHVWLGTFFSCTFLFICQCVFVVCAPLILRKNTRALSQSLRNILYGCVYSAGSFLIFISLVFCNFANVE